MLSLFENATFFQARDGRLRREASTLTRWSGKTAVIVGGSAGLGKTLADKLAQSQVGSLLIVARNSERLQLAVAELQARWPAVTIESCSADVGSLAGSRRVADKLNELGWSVDLLINAVGLSDRGLLTTLTAERMEELLRANIYGPLWSTQSLVPLMRAGSVIVNIGSLASYFAPRYMGGYSIVKHGLRGLTQQLRLELADQNIHVMLVCPGPIKRSDSDSRYAHLPTANDLPPEALKSGGGAKIKGLDPQRLAEEILQAAAAGKLELVRPGRRDC